MRRRLIALSVVFAAHTAWLAVVAEDAFISLRFARNLARGWGMVWNPGEAPVEGVTNLLWTLLAAGVERLGLDGPGTMQLLGVATGLATLWLTDRFAVRVLDLRGLARTFPVLMLAVSGPMATWAASGLETPLFSLLAIASLYAMARWRGSESARDLALAWTAVVLATLTRPEGLLLAAIAGWMTLAGDGERHRRQAWTAVGAFVLFAVALTALRLAYFDAPLPNTFYAKTGGGGLQVLRGAAYLGYFAFHYLTPLLPLVAVAWSRPRSEPQGHQWTVVAALLAWCGGYALYIVAVGGDYMAMYRFFVPVLPAFYLLVGLAAKRAFTPGLSHRLRGALVVFAVVGTLVHSTPYEADLYDKPPRQHGTWRGVETERWHVARLERVARFFAQRAAGHSDASVATRAIGILGYRTELTVYDFHGLVDSKIARQGVADRPIGAGLPGHEKTDYEHVLGKRPTWWMFTRTLRSEAAGWPRYDRETDRRLRREYRLVTVELEDPENREEGCFSFLELKSVEAPGDDSDSDC